MVQIKIKMAKDYSMAQDFNSSTLGAVTSVCLFIISKIFLIIGIENIADLAAVMSIVAASVSIIINFPKLRERIQYLIKKYL